MKDHPGDLTVCPECGDDGIEFVQFATGEEETVVTTPEEVGTGLLALYSCGECRSGLEIVLKPDRHRAIQHE